MSGLDVACARVTRLIDINVHRNTLCIEHTVVAELKQLCKYSHAAIDTLFKSLMSKLTATHPVSRLLALYLIDVFFQRSARFRSLVTRDLDEFFVCVLGTHTARPLPSPAKSAQYLKSEGVRIWRAWYASFHIDRRIQLAHNFLCHEHGLLFEDPRVQAEQRIQQASYHRQRIARAKFNQIHLELPELTLECNNVITEMDNGFELLASLWSSFQSPALPSVYQPSIEITEPVVTSQVQLPAANNVHVNESMNSMNSINSMSSMSVAALDELLFGERDSYEDEAEESDADLDGNLDGDHDIDWQPNGSSVTRHLLLAEFSSTDTVFDPLLSVLSEAHKVLSRRFVPLLQSWTLILDELNWNCRVHAEDLNINDTDVRAKLREQREMLEHIQDLLHRCHELCQQYEQLSAPKALEVGHKRARNPFECDDGEATSVASQDANVLQSSSTHSTGIEIPTSAASNVPAASAPTNVVKSKKSKTDKLTPQQRVLQKMKTLDRRR